MMGAPSTKRVKISDNSLEWVCEDTAFKNRICTGVIVNHDGFKDPKQFLAACLPIFTNKMLELNRAVRINVALLCKFLLPKSGEITEMYMNTKNTPLLPSDDISEWYSINVTERLLKKLGAFQVRDSGWALKEIMKVCFNVNVNKGFHAGTHRKLPKVITDKKAVVNVDSKYDDYCFKWAIIAGLHPVNNHVDRVASYIPYSQALNFANISFPTELNHVGIFEKNNVDVSVNVYGIQYSEDKWMVIGGAEEEYEEKKFQVVPLHVSKHYKRERHVNLLMLPVANSELYHFCNIRNLSRLARSGITAHHHSIEVCERCLCYFHSKEKLAAHLADCSQFKGVRSIMPKPEKQFIKFDSYNRQLKLPFVIYADIECLLEPGVSNEIHAHKPYSIAFYVHCNYSDENSEFQLYRGADCMEWFTNQLYRIAERIQNYLLQSKQMIISVEEEEMFRTAKTCHICKEGFTKTDVKHRDHCHFTGRFRGASHDSCNLNYRPNFTVPVVFHNLTNYDSHFIITNICERVEEKVKINPGHVSVIAENMEKYKTFTKSVAVGYRSDIKFRFIDSFNFLVCSLEKCVSYLKPEELKITREHFPNSDQFNLINKKSVFPYEHVTHESVLLEEQLPAIEAFKSLLNGERAIQEEDYQRACNVWSLFDCKTLGDYSDLYLKTDVLLLADVFENFRTLCLKTYELDPAYYVTSPGLAWDALLKTTKERLQLITDIEQLQFVERGIRGGIVHCSHRHVVANNRFMADYDENKDESYIIYLDVNSLYSWAMMQHLPHSEFAWMPVEGFDVESVSDDSNVGYILEVDLEYPENLHELHSDLPLCPEKIVPPPSINKPGVPKKLVSTLHDKKNYVIHYRNLKQCLRNNLVLRKIHRILSFRQSAWMKPYIDINAEKRMNAKNEFEKNFFKLMNNSVFGKTMQNVRNMSDVKLVTSWEGRYGAAALVARPNFKRSIIFNENLVGIEMSRLNIVFDKPVAIGMSVLDISKTLLIDFHYDYMLKKFGAKDVKMCYTDTDSLIYYVRTSNIYDVIKNDVHMWFDTSAYPDNNVYNIPRANKKKVGLMKDELSGEIITEFIGLRAKMYALETELQRVVRRAKGVKRSSVKELTIDDYRQCLLNDAEKSTVQYLIRSKLHTVSTLKQSKLALSAKDDKRFILDDKVSTFAWGHYQLKNDDCSFCK